MNTIIPDGANVTFGKSQPDYNALPAKMHENGSVITCFELTDEEIKEIIKNKKLYINILTFNNPLQPILPSVYRLDLNEKGETVQYVSESLNND